MKKFSYLASLWLISQFVQADTTLVYEGENAERYSTYVAAGKVRVDGDASQYIVFDTAADKLQVVDRKHQRYSEMDGQSMRNLAAQVSGLKTQLEGVMAGMSPEQRAQLERFGIKGAEEVPAVSVRKTGKQSRVGEWRCEQLVLIQGDKQVGEMCMAKGQVMGIPPEDIAAMVRLQRFAKEIARSVGPAFGAAELASAWEAGDQMPLRMNYVDNGHGYTRTLTNFSTHKVDTALFKVPAGYQRQQSPLGSPR